MNYSFPVHLLAFDNHGEIRMVRVPRNNVVFEEDGTIQAKDLLSQIFYYGQNENVISIAQRSVSAGDVVEFQSGKLYMYMPVGFQRISKKEFETYQKLETYQKFNWLFEWMRTKMLERNS